MPNLTKRQKEIFDYLKSFVSKKGYSPTVEEIRKYFKLAAISTVHEHLMTLEEKGYIKKDEHKARGFEILEDNKMVSIPLLGCISAGQPIEALEERSLIAVPQNRVVGSGNFFALKVVGDSMIDEKIDDGDIVIVKSQNTADEGQKVVALVNNCEVTLKKFYREKNRIRLQPANSNIDPIFVNKKDLMIQGVVVDLIKSINKKNIDIVSIQDIVPAEKKVDKKKVLNFKKLLNKVILEDVELGLQKIPDESCDVIIVDPPYNIGKNFGNNFDKKELNEYIEWSKKWINECIRVMKPNATMFIYGFSEILAHLSVEISLDKRWLIWHYTNKNVASLNFWQRSHESIICCWKDERIFNRDDVREPYTDGFLNGAAGKVRKGTVGRFSRNGKETVYNAHEGGALPRDVIKIPALAGGAGMNERWFMCKTCNAVCEPRELKKHREHEIIKHPTQKPLDLSKKLIKSCIQKTSDNIVLVPFVGSGSECVAAKQLGFPFLGFDINPDYIEMANEILRRTKHQDTFNL